MFEKQKQKKITHTHRSISSLDARDICGDIYDKALKLQPK